MTDYMVSVRLNEMSDNLNKIKEELGTLNFTTKRIAVALEVLAKVYKKNSTVQYGTEIIEYKGKDGEYGQR